MLIVSPRHTRADRAHWSALERLDAMYSSAGLLDKKEAHALVVLHEFFSRRAIVSVSWGKDSVVVAHLAQRVAPDVALVWFPAPGIENPDNVTVRDSFLADYPDVRYSEIEAGLSSDDWDRHQGHDGAQAEFVAASRGVCRRYVSGVRAEESGIRRMSLRSLGETTRYTCRPIGWWTSADVFAYLHRYELPVHPAYACSYGGTLDRGRIRVSTIGGASGTERGRREWERRYYRATLTRIIDTAAQQDG